MVLIIRILRGYSFETHWGILMVKLLAMMKASNWYSLLVKCLSLYLEMYMEPYVVLMWENLVSLNGSFDGSNYNKLEVLLLGGSMGYTDGKVIGSDEGT